MTANKVDYSMETEPSALHESFTVHNVFADNDMEPMTNNDHADPVKASDSTHDDWLNVDDVSSVKNNNPVNKNQENEDENTHPPLYVLPTPGSQLHPPILLSDGSSKLGTVALAVLVFYSVSGGPFGCEETIQAAGNYYTLVGFAVFPFIWSIQEALITAELGTAFPEASGGVAWVEEAFGTSLAWMTGWLGYVAGTTDNAIYPVLFLEYLLQLVGGGKDVDLNPFVRFALLAMTCIVLSFVNWLGLAIVGRVSIFICILAMSPFIIMSLAGLSQIDSSRWSERPDPDTAAVVAATGLDISGGPFPNAVVAGVLLRPYLNNLFWNLNSYNSAATFAGDVEDPGKVLPRAMYLALVLVSVGYLIPLLVTLGASNATQIEWQDGYFATAATQIVGPWLGAWTVFASGISNIALFQAELSTESFQLMGMADRGHVPKIFTIRSRFDTPTAAIILSNLFMISMSFANLSQLIEMLNFNYSIGLLIEFAAFIKLRISEPNLSRPYRIPLSTPLCIIAIIPTIAAILMVMLLAKYSTMAFSLLVMALGCLVFLVARPGVLAYVCENGCRRRGKQKKLRTQPFPLPEIVDNKGFPSSQFDYDGEAGLVDVSERTMQNAVMT